MDAEPVRTLIVDDHADVRFLIRTIVGDAGLPVEVVGEADGVESALAQLDALGPDVVVMDARMPRIDGFEAAPLLLARRPDVSIVLCSAWVDDDVRRRAAEAGIRTVLSKDQFEEIPAVVLDVAGRDQRSAVSGQRSATSPARRVDGALNRGPGRRSPWVMSATIAIPRAAARPRRLLRSGDLPVPTRSWPSARRSRSGRSGGGCSNIAKGGSRVS